MTRVKRGPQKNKKRKNILAKTKGYRHGRSSKLKQAREAIYHAGNHAFAHRRRKKSVFRQGWHIAIGTALEEHGLSFSKFIGSLNKKGALINKKMLAEIAENEPEAFKRIVEYSK